MRNQVIRDRFAALTVLSQRALPSSTAQNKVDSLLARYEIPYNVTEKRKKLVIATSPVPETWDRDTLPMPIAEARQAAMDAMLEESQPVKKIPEHLRLTAADMPIALKGEKGADNVAGNAQIKRLLGSLYKPTTPEELQFAAPDEKDAGEETDDDYTPPVIDPQAPHTE